MTVEKINHNFYKLIMLTDIDSKVAEARNKLLNDLIDFANDPTIWKRRFRMLSQLSQWHSDIIKKIYQFETDDIQDYFSNNPLVKELEAITSKNA